MTATPAPSTPGSTVPLRIAVLASGRGSNLQALIDAQRDGTLAVEIVLVASDKPHAPALQRATEAGLATQGLDPKRYLDRASFDAALFDAVASSQPDLIVLAGFMRILDPAVLAPWVGRIVNIHPSLLPKHRGLHTHRRAIEAGDTMHGASVHYVTAELDGGPVIAQAAIPVESGDTPESLAMRLLDEEHRLLVASIALLATGRISLQGPTVLCDATPLTAPLQLDANGSLRREPA